MALKIDRGNTSTFNDANSTVPNFPIPENDLRSSTFQQQDQLHHAHARTATCASPSAACRECQSLGQEHHPQHTPPAGHKREFSESFSNHVCPHPMHAEFPPSKNGDGILHDSAMNETFPDIMSDHYLAEVLANFQPCGDCTPATKTAIPHHHHHTSGRLSGTSAQLDGHFCCCWLVHDQPCFLCFASAEALDNHIKSDHAGKDGTYRCFWQDCSKHAGSKDAAGPLNYGNKPKLMRHVHSHTGYKPFTCEHPGCYKAFVTKEQLKNHETTHTKSRKYQCDQCGKAFAVKSALTTHITAVHEEKKTHTCEICGKAFADSSNLSKHKQTHFRDNTLRKQRSRRGRTSATSTYSTPPSPTPSEEPATPYLQVSNLQNLNAPPITTGLMGPPSLPKVSIPPLSSSIPMTCTTNSAPSTTSSPPPEIFDPDCYCCEQQCPLPEGPTTPCDEAEDCDRDGFCDLPECAPSPCNEAESCCAREDFCDLPNCFDQQGCQSAIPSTNVSMAASHCAEPLMHHQIEQLRNFQLPPRWDDYMDSNFQDSHRSFSQLELEQQFTEMDGSYSSKV